MMLSWVRFSRSLNPNLTIIYLKIQNGSWKIQFLITQLKQIYQENIFICRFLNPESIFDLQYFENPLSMVSGKFCPIFAHSPKNKLQE